jgi:cell division transport system ATP-binding protein
MVRFDKVVKRYPGGHEALRGVSLDVEAGEFLAIIGPSGAGKSTLLRMLPALERPTSGGVSINGEEISRIRPAAIPWLRRRLGVILQDQRLLNDRSVIDNVMLPLRVAGYATEEALRRARAALDKVGLRERERANPVALSGGEQQRLAIARAVVGRPALLIADEPTSNLDAAQAADIAAVFKSFNDVGTTILIATHDTQLARRFATRVVTLADGQVVQ